MALAAEPVKELTREEGRALLDRQARRYLGISGEEFARRFEAGELDEDLRRPEVMRLVMLLPFGR